MSNTTSNILSSPAHPGQSPPLLSWDQSILEYLTARRQEGLSRLTVGSYDPAPLDEQSGSTLGKYGARLVEIKSHFVDQQVLSPVQVDRSALSAWGASLWTDRAVATVRGCISVARSFFGWLHLEGYISPDPSLALKLPRPKRRLQRTLSADEVRAVFKGCRHPAQPRIVQIRDLALLSLLVDAGLRASEVCKLNCDDISLAAVQSKGEPLHFLTVEVKGGDESFGYFSDETAARLQAWLDSRSRVAYDKRVKALFVAIGGTQPGRRLTRSGVGDICARVAVQAGIPHFSPHALRRSFACLAVDAGAPTRVVQDLGRWRTLDMVELYTRNYRAAARFRQYSPVSYVS